MDLLRVAGLRVTRSTYAVSLLYPAKLLAKVIGPLVFRGKPESHTFLRLPQIVNSFLIALMRLEAGLLRRVNLPFGTSVFCVARKEKKI